ncbi:hypothetical protein PAMP_001071 [Pampus punctatissimus]
MYQQKSSLKEKYQEARLGEEERRGYVRRFNCELLKKRLHNECSRQLEFNKEKQRFLEEIRKQDKEALKRGWEKTNLIDKMAEQEKEKEEKRAAMLQAIAAHRKIQEKRLHNECSRQLEFNKEKQRFLEEIRKQDEEASKCGWEKTNLIDKMAEQEKEKEEKRAAMLQAIAAHRKIQERDLEERRKKKDEEEEEEQSNLEWQAQKESTWLFLKKSDLIVEKVEETNLSQIKNTDSQSLKETAMGKPSSAVGKKESLYYSSDTGERLPVLRTAKTQAVKQHQERNSLQLTYVEAGEIDIKPNPPISTKIRQKPKNNLALKETTMEKPSSAVGKKESLYYSSDTGEQLPVLRTAKTQAVKQHQERNSLQLTYVEAGEIDVKPNPPISTKIRQKPKNNLALKETTMGKPSSSVGKKEYLYYSSDTGERLPVLRTAKTQAVKQHQERNSLQLTYVEAGEIDMKPNSPISTKIRQKPKNNLALKETTMEKPSSAVGKKESLYYSSDTGERLPVLRTAKTQAVKQHQERNSLQLTYVEAGEIDVKPNPPISTKIRQKPKNNLALKETTMGKPSSSVGKKEYLYYSSDTGERLPVLRTAKTQAVKQHQERNSLQLTYVEAGEIDVKPNPPISTKIRQKPTNNLALKETTMGKPSSAVSKKESLYYSSDTGERLPVLRTAKTQAVKQHQERNSLQLTYVDAGETDVKPNPPISTKIRQKPTNNLALKETTMGKPSSAVGKKEFIYCASDTGERLPVLRTAKTQAVKQHQERNSLQLTYVEAGETDVKPNPPISTKIRQKPTNNLALKETIMEQCGFTVQKAVTIKEYLKPKELQLNYKKNIKGDFRSPCLPPISVKAVPAGRRYPPASVEGSQNCYKGRGEPLPQMDTDNKTRSTKKCLEQLPYKKKCIVDFRSPVLPPIIVKAAPLQLP